MIGFAQTGAARKTTITRQAIKIRHPANFTPSVKFNEIYELLF